MDDTASATNAGPPAKTTSTTIKINEIFYSIQGESSYAGHPTVFIRTAGCNLRCGYCDTKYAYTEGDFRTIDDILREASSHRARYACVTGGEPLAQKSSRELLRRLCDKGYRASLETSGSFDCGEVDPRVKLVIDVKTPGSGEVKSFCRENLRLASATTEFKFVICSEEDFAWSARFAGENRLFELSQVLFSPAFGQVSEEWLARKILSDAPSARLQLQLHKYIWSPHSRGV
jgi:7-carboxy-7-deazaguanine synthase